MVLQPRRKINGPMLAPGTTDCNCHITAIVCLKTGDPPIEKSDNVIKHIVYIGVGLKVFSDGLIFAGQAA